MTAEPPAATERRLRRLARRAATQPIAVPVAADDARFLAAKGEPRLAWRVLRRHAEMALSGQRPRQVQRIGAGWKRAVWFHAEAPQIGDALMDLAPRSLLAEHGIALDLLAPPQLAALFRGDRWLHRVTGDEAAIDAAAYDFALVDSDCWKAVAAKRRRAPDLPWASIRGDYLAYDFHRGLLATRRLAELLHVRLGADEETRHARQKLEVAVRDEGGGVDGDASSIAAGPPRIGLAVGGVRAERTYGDWAGVARGLAAAGLRRFALFGSANGATAATQVRRALSRVAGTDVLDLVARTDLHGTQRAMRDCAAVACADGGLMHLAFAAGVPVVALFDASVDPAWRLPPGDGTRVLRASARDVGAVGAADVVAAVLAAAGARPLDAATGRVSGAPSAA